MQMHSLLFSIRFSQRYFRSLKKYIPICGLIVSVISFLGFSMFEWDPLIGLQLQHQKAILINFGYDLEPLSF